MKELEKHFKKNQWGLISEILTNGRKEEDGTTIKWSTLAMRHNIKVGGTTKQRRVAANDVWRRFLKTIEKKELDLVTVKQTVNGSGEILFETRKALPESKEYSTEGMIIDKVTTNPSCGEWITYRNKKAVAEIEEDNSILSAMDRLFEKYVVADEPVFAFNEDIVEKEEFFADPKGRLAIFNLYDAHLDKIPVKSVCGVESTLEENIAIFERTISRMVEQMRGQNIEKIILPVGNDLFHTNGFGSVPTTKKGTVIEYYGSPEDAYYSICDVVTQMVFNLSVIAPVEVIMVKGNHDEDKMTTLGYWLDRVFKYTPGRAGHEVTVDYLRKQRKYIKYGENLIGFAHGDKEKSKIAQLPLIMAQEAKEMWGTTTYRKMYLGDLHHGFEYQFMKAKDMPGVEVEYLRSVGTTDGWHEDFGWIGVPKTAYLQIIDKEEGEFSRMKFNIK